MYYGMFYDWTFLLLIPALVLSIVAQGRVQRAYAQYARVPVRAGISGAMAARMILDAHGLGHVAIEQVGGTLSDHYDPRSRIMRLSGDVYRGASIASVAIAAHESGHAIQHGEQYTLLTVRNRIAGPVSVFSRASWILIILGIVVAQAGQAATGDLLFDIGCVAFAAVVVFHLVTLPVELDASRRALTALQGMQIVLPEESAGAKKVLSAAALTYVAALAVSVLQLIRILLIRGRD